MRRPTRPRPRALELQLGSRLSTAGILRLDFGGAPECERPNLLREFFERLGVRYDAEPLGDVPFEIDMTLQALPGLQLFSGIMCGSRTRRTRQSNDSTDDVGLMVNLQGPHLISQRGREIVLGDGEATLVSLTETLGSTHRPPGDLLVLRFPRDKLAPLLGAGQGGFLRRVPCGTPALSLLTSYVEIARDEQTLADRAVQHLMVTHFYDLMAVALGATRDAAEVARDGGMRAARRYAIKQDIAGGLDQPDLSVTALAARHGCTPRYIQRLFETEGTTFTEYVLAQRLTRAHGMLSNPRRGERISAVAYDCGFGDLSYFNRVFRRRYGAAPSDVRAQARQGEAEGPDGPPPSAGI